MYSCELGGILFGAVDFGLGGKRRGAEGGSFLRGHLTHVRPDLDLQISDDELGDQQSLISDQSPEVVTDLTDPGWAPKIGPQKGAFGSENDPGRRPAWGSFLRGIPPMFGPILTSRSVMMSSVIDDHRSLINLRRSSRIRLNLIGSPKSGPTQVVSAAKMTPAGDRPGGHF